LSAYSATPFIERLVRLAGEGAHSQACALYLLDASGRFLHPEVVIGLPPSYVDACGPVEVGTQCCGRAVEHKKPWLVADMKKDPLFASAKKATVVSDIRAAFSVPVLGANGKVYGSLSCHYKRPYRASAQDIERNEIFAKLIAFALEEKHEHIDVAAVGD
jgi:GAF domain-containing protein